MNLGLQRWGLKGTVMLALGVGLALAAEPEHPIPREKRQSGYAFLSPETQALQDDPWANPGLLWVDQGAELWRQAPGSGAKACSACHGDDGQDLVGAATRYPAFDDTQNALLNLEQRINSCRQHRQGLEPLAYESDALLSLTTFVANLSAGLSVNVTIDGPARPHFEAGRDYFYRRRGQLNLACHQCHDSAYGRMLRGDRISQGHGNGFPTYRLEWQTVGSLHRRLRACDLGVRAEPFGYGSAEYVNLELFLAWRARGLPIETPAVRR
ncbi:MAG: sulfur oxidation c-type cytochrome SoxA [Candidatus Competibacterales bacterium]